MESEETCTVLQEPNGPSVHLETMETSLDPTLLDICTLGALRFGDGECGWTPGVQKLAHSYGAALWIFVSRHLQSHPQKGPLPGPHRGLMACSLRSVCTTPPYGSHTQSHLREGNSLSVPGGLSSSRWWEESCRQGGQAESGSLGWETTDMPRFHGSAIYLICLHEGPQNPYDSQGQRGSHLSLGVCEEGMTTIYEHSPLASTQLRVALGKVRARGFLTREVFLVVEPSLQPRLYWL